MGAKRITPEEIEKMILLYDKLGTYAAVAREIKRSPRFRGEIYQEEQAARQYSDCACIIGKEKRRIRRTMTKRYLCIWSLFLKEFPAC